MLEPGVALVVNRLGDVLAHTSGFDLVARPTGLLDARPPNITRFVFTDPCARDVFPDGTHVADHCAFDLWLGPTVERSTRFSEELAEVAGDATRSTGKASTAAECGARGAPRASSTCR